ncbi:CaiB/BaiF CoA-transferase family protein [Pyruvatibacter sp.]|uniref:CaiB/BaiF CoA transferase family protein n=1 Tax=Pyruvatibacter sp. TaxID=1981328 RepID=UPI0032EB87D3
MLEGIRVVELATYIAAPAAAGIMADWGAEVIKVEPLQGDAIRGMLKNVSAANVEGNPIFDMDNRGKRGLAIDLRNDKGAEALRKLVLSADVFITNVRPGGLARAGLDWETLRKEKPELIYASVTGYGLEGEDQDRPGFDMAAFWARSGVASLTAPKGTDPFPLRVGLGDHTTGMATLNGILGALFDRTRTGKGRLIEASLLRTGIYSIASDMAIQLRYGRVASTKSRELAVNALNNFFQCACGTWLCLLTRHSGDIFGPIAAALGKPELAKEERFLSAKSRRENAAELVHILDAEFAKYDIAEWGRRLDEHDVVWAPVQTPAQVADDTQAQAAGAFVDIPDHAGGTGRSVASPVRLPNDDGTTEDRVRGPAPGIGEHTAEILKEIGYDDAGVEALKAAGAIN